MRLWKHVLNVTAIAEQMNDLWAAGTLPVLEEWRKRGWEKKKREEKNKVKKIGKTPYCSTNGDNLTLEASGLWKGLWSKGKKKRKKSCPVNHIHIAQSHHSRRRIQYTNTQSNYSYTALETKHSFQLSDFTLNDMQE